VFGCHGSERDPGSERSRSAGPRAPAFLEHGAKCVRHHSSLTDSQDARSRGRKEGVPTLDPRLARCGRRFSPLQSQNESLTPGSELLRNPLRTRQFFAQMSNWSRIRSGRQHSSLAAAQKPLVRIRRDVQVICWRVRAAFLAAADRCLGLFLRAADLVCFARDLRDAAALVSRFNALVTARERFGEGFRGFFPRSKSSCALCRVSASPVLGGDNFTPARRAFDRPMAMACFVERAPCLPSRIW
jgi:hypothetical protein